MAHTEDHTREERRDATRHAVELALSSPVAWSMTPRQLAVLHQLGNLQIEHAGPHSLLPNVMAALVDLARRPWWDAGVAVVLDEPLGERGDAPRDEHL